MPSFDIVSEITMHEVRNAVENANRVLRHVMISVAWKRSLN